MACFLFVFSIGRLAVPTQDMDLRHATLFLSAPRVSTCKQQAQKERWMDMINWCGLDMGMSVSEVAEGAAAVLVAVGGVIGGCFTYRKWSVEKALKRAESLDVLLEKFTNDKVRSFICRFASAGGASGLFAQAKPGSKEEFEIENSLMFLSQLCNMRMSKAISKKEFLLFEDSVLRVLSDDDVKRYINNALMDADIHVEKSHYGLLVAFAHENGIDMNKFEMNNALPDKQGAKDNAVEQIENQVSAEMEINPEIEFDKPTAIIKINRFYRDGMDEETEVYNTVRGWWRLRLDVANNVKLVLAVAYGVVRGVYKVNDWIVSANPADAGRIGFIGEIAEKSVHDKFINRSVRSLFPRGAANPVKYFNLGK